MEMSLRYVYLEIEERLSIRFDVLRCWIVCRVATDIDRVLGLINANPINTHGRWKCQFGQVDLSEIHR